MVLKRGMVYLRKIVNFMYRILFLCFVAVSFSSYGKKDFGNSSLGFGLGYGYNRGDFDRKTFKGMGFIPQIMGGYGWVKEQSYYGLEGSIGYDSFSKKKEVVKLKKSWNIGVSFRIGKIIRSYFLPFLRVGFDYNQYKISKSSFGSYGLLLGLGVDAFINDDFTIRSEFLHGRSVGFNHLKNTSNKKPLYSTLVMSISYHFS